MVFEKVKNILMEELDVDEVKLESKIQEDLGADSLDMVEVVMAIEDEFGIEIDEEDTVNIKTVKNIVTFIENRKNKS
ncbi:acyl carrier protein [Abyssisolibacter fermentans]|uniref:acyl carrier protein n=1 Tax=Abyssisolibacter fermentans TaxID=1766203 RepID=UPI000836B6B8|nr:acyl carrier protein [Abyssisolibacter fermentans]